VDCIIFSSLLGNCIIMRSYSMLWHLECMSSVVEMIREHIRAVNSIQTCTLIVPSIILLEVSSFCDFSVTDTIAHLKSLTSRSAQFIRSRFPRESPL